IAANFETGCAGPVSENHAGHRGTRWRKRVPDFDAQAAFAIRRMDERRARVPASRMERLFPGASHLAHARGKATRLQEGGGTMATVKRLTPGQVLFRFVPTIALLIVSFYYIRISNHSVWETDCKRFVAASDWSSLISLSANLQQVGKVDPQMLFFGLMAAVRAQDQDM